MLLLALVACKHVDPAPADVDGLFHFFWTGYVDADDPSLAAAVDNAYTAMHGATVTDPTDGTITDLASDELSVVQVSGTPDPAAAAGIFVVDVVPCALADVEKVLDAQDQASLFPGSYDTYDREFTSDPAAYEARTTPTLSWDVHLSSTLLGASYHEHLSGGLRYVAEGDHGPTILARTFEVEPATFDDSSKSFPQDYQIEVYSQRKSAETVHFYGIWREIDAGSGLTMDSTLVQRTTINGLESWDEQMGKDCSAS